jgi:hypothetical protein
MVNSVKQAKQSSPLGSDCLQIYKEADWIKLLAKLKQSSSNLQSGLLVDNCGGLDVELEPMGVMSSSSS